MSIAPGMPPSPQPAAAPPRSLLRQWLFPILVLALCAAFFVVVRLVPRFLTDVEDWMPYLMLGQMLAILLTALTLLVWLMFFSGFWWRTRFFLLGVALVLGCTAGAGFYQTIRKVELTTKPWGMVPVFHFIWEKSADEQFAEYLQKETSTPNDFPKLDATVGPEDFASYRGPRRDGVVSHFQLQTDWKQHPPQIVWKHPCVEGYSGIAVAGNIIVTIENRDKKEAVVCYDRTTGRQRWTYAYDAFYRDKMNMGDGPRSTPTIHKGRIFTIGGTGEMVCLNFEGKLQWKVNLLDDSKAKNVTWGLTCSPLIVGDLVIANPGVDKDDPGGASLVAFDQATGKKQWAVGNRRASYSSPQLATLDGCEQILVFDGEGLVSYDPATKKELWNFPWETKMDMNMIQPLVFAGDRVFISSEKENGCAMLHVKASEFNSLGKGVAWKVEVLWKNRNLGARFANPVSDGKRIFGLHGVTGIQVCLDVETGKQIWKNHDEIFGPGQMLLIGDTLMVISEEGVASLWDTKADEAKKLASFQVLDAKTKTWNTPALAGDQLFVRNQKEIVCLKLSRR